MSIWWFVGTFLSFQTVAENNMARISGSKRISYFCECVFFFLSAAFNWCELVVATKLLTYTILHACETRHFPFDIFGACFNFYVSHTFVTTCFWSLCPALILCVVSVFLSPALPFVTARTHSVRKGESEMLVCVHRAIHIFLHFHFGCTPLVSYYVLWQLLNFIFIFIVNSIFGTSVVHGNCVDLFVVYLLLEHSLFFTVPHVCVILFIFITRKASNH